MAVSRQEKQEAILPNLLEYILRIRKLSNRQRFQELQAAKPVWEYQQIGPYTDTGILHWEPRVNFESYRETSEGREWACKGLIDGVHFYLVASGKSEIHGTIYYAFTGAGLWEFLSENI